MQLDYPIETPKALAGLPSASGVGAFDESFKNPNLAQITNVAIDTEEDGDWSITLTDDETGETVTTAAFTASTSTEAQIAAGLEANLDALSAPWAQRFTASVTDDDITIAFADAQRGRAWTVTVNDPGGTAASTVSNTQEPGGVSHAFGTWAALESGSNDTARQVASGDATGDMVGVALRPVYSEVTRPEDGGLLAADLDEWPVGHVMPVRRRGRVWVPCEESVDRSDTPHVRLASGTIIGAMTGTADGGNTLDVSSLCRFIDFVADTSSGLAGFAEVELFIS